MKQIKLISISPDAEKTMAYCARVSNPLNQDSDSFEPLLRYCIRHGHWSVFEQANMVLEINTSRAIAAQILRHRSFCFQEFSQRYAAATDNVVYKARRQDTKNKQNSIDDLDVSIQDWFMQTQQEIWTQAYAKYTEALEKGIAKECARMFLPLNTSTRLYMNGNIRSWIHYINLRSGHGTQLEHQEIAIACKEIFVQELPLLAKALGWADAPIAM